jgi:hypothetical protein
MYAWVIIVAWVVSAHGLKRACELYMYGMWVIIVAWVVSAVNWRRPIGLRYLYAELSMEYKLLPSRS